MRIQHWGKAVHVGNDDAAAGAPRRQREVEDPQASRPILSPAGRGHIRACRLPDRAAQGPVPATPPTDIFDMELRALRRTRLPHRTGGCSARARVRRLLERIALVRRPCAPPSSRLS